MQAVIGRAEIQIRDIQHWWCDSDPFPRGSQKNFSEIEWSSYVTSSLTNNLPWLSKAHRIRCTYGGPVRPCSSWPLLLSSALVLGIPPPTLLWATQTAFFQSPVLALLLCPQGLCTCYSQRLKLLLHSFHFCAFSLTPTKISCWKSFALGSHL